MKNKQCGNCEFWDREHTLIYGAIDKPRADCLAPVPDSVWNSEKWDMTETDGQGCPVYKLQNSTNSIPQK